MKYLFTLLSKYKLVSIALCIYLLFYVSLIWTHWFDIFFSGAALHIGFQWIDYLHLPRGAWAFWHGGSLSGDPLPDGEQYGQQYYAMGNIYHPLFTLVFGSFLMQFSPVTGAYVWLAMKLLLTLAGVSVFYWSFRDQKYVQYAVFILLVSGNAYIELAAWQAQQVLNVCLLLFLICLVKKKPVFWTGPLYWFSLLVKPIGLLFLPVLIFKKRWKEAVIGFALFLFTTLIFGWTGWYYESFLLGNWLLPIHQGPTQIITLDALLRYITHWPDFTYKAIEYLALACILALSTFQRIHISKSIYLSIVFFLCFYDMTFEYDWSTLNVVVAICLVTCPSFQTRWSRTCIALICLPSCLIILRLFHIDVIDNQPGDLAWKFMVISKLLPLFALTVCAFASDVKVIFSQIKTLWTVIRKANKYLQVFGEEEKISIKL